MTAGKRANKGREQLCRAVLAEIEALRADVTARYCDEMCNESESDRRALVDLLAALRALRMGPGLI